MTDRATTKRNDIVEAGAVLFLRHGYRGTSMDEVARGAKVSKQTIYQYFKDKQSLFAEIVGVTVNQASEPVYAEVAGLEDSEDVEGDLRRLARRQLRLVMEPRLLQLRRLVIGESARFPELGATFYERGPERTMNALAAAFGKLAARGELDVGDANLAAAHFNWLVMSTPLNLAMLLGDDRPSGPAELDRHADAGVDAFLAVYGPLRRRRG